MCNKALHIDTLDNANESFSTFSTLHLLRSCNRFMLPNTNLHSCYSLKSDQNETSSTFPENVRPQDFNRNSSPLSPELNITDLSAIESDTKIVTSTDLDEGNENKDSEHLKSMETLNTSDSNFPLYRNGNGLLPISIGSFGFLPGSKKNTLPGFQYIAPPGSQLSITPPVEFPLMELNRTASYPLFLHRRSRGEKRPIPEEQKDEKYFERRKRNNEAAKKSRDARKLREDRIAFRAALLEQENSILRAQLLSLRDELQAMRQIISTTTAAATVV